jgi:predicted DNA-binding protein with PD1-like motif
MQYKKFNDDYVLRLEKGEEVIEQIKQLCRKENIKLGTITGLGAANLVEIGLFNTRNETISNRSRRRNV